MDFAGFFKLLQEELFRELPAFADIRLNDRGSGHGGVIIRTPSDLFSFLIPLDRYFEAFRKGASLAEVTAEILSVYGMESLHPLYSAEDFPSRRDFLAGLRLQPASLKHSRRALEALPHVIRYGIAFLLTVSIPAPGEKLGTSPVTEPVLKHFGLSTETAVSAALGNLQRLMPAVMLPLYEYLERLSDIDPELKHRLSSSALDPKHHDFRILTNRSSEFGAAALLYPGITEKLYRSFGEYYLLPSSVHEVLILPCAEEVSPLVLKGLIRTVNHSLASTQMILSDELYRYDERDGLHTV